MPIQPTARPVTADDVATWLRNEVDANNPMAKWVQDELRRLENDLADALDLKDGHGPSVLTMVVNQRNEAQQLLDRIDHWDEMSFNFGDRRYWHAEIAKQLHREPLYKDGNADFEYKSVLAELEQARALSATRGEAEEITPQQIERMNTALHAAHDELTRLHRHWVYCSDKHSGYAEDPDDDVMRQVIEATLAPAAR